MIWVGLVPICIPTNFPSIGVLFLSSLRNYLYIFEFLNLVLILFEGFRNVCI
jgi:hypothetical protein